MEGDQSKPYQKGGAPLKVVMVVASPFPANHGTPGSIREMALALAQRGHQVHIVTYHFGEAIDLSGLYVHRIPDLGLRRRVVVGPTIEKPFFDLLMVIKLIQVIVKEGIDLIHAHNYEGALIGAVARILTRRPLIYNAINTMSDELPSYNFIRPASLAFKLGQLLDHSVPRMADRVIAISDDLALLLERYGVPPERIHRIPLGVDTRPFDTQDPMMARSLLNRTQTPWVIYTGTLDRFQRIDYLLKAMQIVTQKVTPVKLLIVTNLVKMEALEECLRMIRELGISENIEIKRNGSFDEIPSLLAAADVAVLCRPNTPGVPVKLLNYMASGKPIVVFRGSGKGLQHLSEAFVVEDHDWQGLAEGIITLLQNPVLAKKLGDQAKKRVAETLCWPKLAEKVEAVYYDTLTTSVMNAS